MRFMVLRLSSDSHEHAHAGAGVSGAIDRPFPRLDITPQDFAGLALRAYKVRVIPPHARVRSCQAKCLANSLSRAANLLAIYWQAILKHADSSALLNSDVKEALKHATRLPLTSVLSFMLLLVRG
jgi:hypothetical protein